MSFNHVNMIATRSVQEVEILKNVFKEYLRVVVSHPGYLSQKLYCFEGNAVLANIVSTCVEYKRTVQFTLQTSVSSVAEWDSIALSVYVWVVSLCHVDIIASDKFNWQFKYRTTFFRIWLTGLHILQIWIYAPSKHQYW